jgi:hypothetical protein
MLLHRNIKEVSAVPIIAENLTDKEEEANYEIMRETLDAKNNVHNSLTKMKSNNSEKDVLRELYDEAHSNLGEIYNPDTEVNWQGLNLEKVFFIVITTHELRRTDHGDLIAPFTRINDGTMHILGFDEASKIEALTLLNKIQSGGLHIDMKKFFHRKLTQIKFEPSKAHID